MSLDGSIGAEVIENEMVSTCDWQMDEGEM